MKKHIVHDRSSHRRYSIKKLLLRISQYSQENTCVGVSFSQSCRPRGLQLYEKETPTQVLSCECSEILKNKYFEKRLRTAASCEKIKENPGFEALFDITQNFMVIK